MIAQIAVILCFQLLGEVISRLALPILPGPVLGLILCVAACMIWPRLAEFLRSAATGILAHLSLLFVPAGVGLVSHWGVITAEGPLLLVVLVLATVTGMTVAAFSFSWVARWMGAAE